MEAGTKGDKPSCNLDELLKRVVEIIKAQETFTGKSRDLQDALGKGSWNTAPNHLRRYLRAIEDRLREAGIAIDLSDERRIVIRREAKDA